MSCIFLKKTSLKKRKKNDGTTYVFEKYLQCQWCRLVIAGHPGRSDERGAERSFYGIVEEWEQHWMLLLLLLLLLLVVEAAEGAEEEVKELTSLI